MKTVTTTSEQSYYEIFSDQIAQCKSKKDYKKLCRLMLKQFEVIDKVDANQWRVFSSLVGSDLYSYGIALAIKMYILEQRGVPVDILTVETLQDSMPKT